MDAGKPPCRFSGSYAEGYPSRTLLPQVKEHSYEFLLPFEAAVEIKEEKAVKLEAASAIEILTAGDVAARLTLQFFRNGEEICTKTAVLSNRETGRYGLSSRLIWEGSVSPGLHVYTLAIIARVDGQRLGGQPFLGPVDFTITYSCLE
ncbi:MAG TPA: hypothetical protein VEY51_20770 [Chondromyces sp.]|nr:hypothetical protein [Chondromyces sp.]